MKFNCRTLPDISLKKPRDAFQKHPRAVFVICRSTATQTYVPSRETGISDLSPKECPHGGGEPAQRIRHFPRATYI
jgi:hypothetical protein